MRTTAIRRFVVQRPVTIFAVFAVAFLVFGCAQTPPPGVFSVHIKVAKGWGDAKAYTLATHPETSGWTEWKVYSDGTNDIAYSTPNTDKATANSVLAKLCKLDRSQKPLRVNTSTGKNVGCWIFDPKPVSTSTGSSGGSSSHYQSGKASFYDERGTIAFPRHRSSNGCAHKTLPAGTRVYVSGPRGSTTCVVDDRGPYVGGRIIDLQSWQFAKIASLSSGVASVRISW